MEGFNNIIYNQKYIIIYALNFIKVYENYTKQNIFTYYILKDDLITDIQFNPILDNIILVSFSKGFCKIYEIVKNKIEEKINFEGIYDQLIVKSKFSYLNPNIIASLNFFKAIIIWDVRYKKYINIIRNSKENKGEKKKKLEEKKEEK